MIPADELFESTAIVPKVDVEPTAAVGGVQDSSAGVRLDSIPEAIAAIRDGKSIVVIDDEDRENEGDLIYAASKATPELAAFMIRYTSGYICVGMSGELLDRTL